MTQLEALTRPFAPDEIQYRPGSALYDHKDACQGPRCRETRDPRKHMQLAFVEDESVMDRLDTAVGIGHWSVLVDPVADGVVKVRLGIELDGQWTWYEDFGYANRAGGEVLKEAVTDGIRRCGRYLGIARDLYRKQDHSGSAHKTTAGPVQPATGAAGRSPRPAAPTVPPEPDDLAETFHAPTGATESHECASADETTRARSGGASMTTKEVLTAADNVGISSKVVGDAAQRLWGTRMLNNLDGEQRAVVWAEVQR